MLGTLSLVVLLRVYRRQWSRSSTLRWYNTVSFSRYILHARRQYLYFPIESYVRSGPSCYTGSNLYTWSICYCWNRNDRNLAIEWLFTYLEPYSISKWHFKNESCLKIDDICRTKVRYLRVVRLIVSSMHTAHRTSHQIGQYPMEFIVKIFIQKRRTIPHYPLAWVRHVRRKYRALHLLQQFCLC